MALSMSPLSAAAWQSSHSAERSYSRAISPSAEQAAAR